jgi:4'-phosphopantetheinyl transferase EntD
MQCSLENWLANVLPEAQGYVSLQASKNEPPEAILHPEEALIVQTLGEKRRQEFILGRTLVHQARKELHLPFQPLLQGSHGEPLWREDSFGCISHSKSHVWVLLAPHPIGIDLECSNRLQPKAFQKALTPKELDWLNHQPESLQGHWATLIFSAKEAYFKLQFPLTQMQLHFQDGCVSIFPKATEGFNCYGKWEITVPKSPIPVVRGDFWIDPETTYTVCKRV